MSPQFLTLSQVDFITVGTAGPPGRPTFYLQASQGDMLISVIIEEEHAAALSLGIDRLLKELGGVLPEDWIPTDLELRHPIQPIFRVESLGLGYDPELDTLVIVARAPVAEADERQDAPEIHLWGTRGQMLALAEHAIEVLAAGLPRCPLCDEPLKSGERHVCTRDNGHKWIYRLDQ